MVRKTRFPAMPDVPSTGESGYPELEANAWFGLFAPAKTPRPVVARLNAEVLRALSSPDVKEVLARSSAEAVPTSPEELAAHVKSELEKWAKVVRDAGLQRQ